MTCKEVASESWSSVNFLTLNEDKHLATVQKIILKRILELQLVTMRSEPANYTVFSIISAETSCFNTD
jgi:hypothetical protein